MGNATCERDDTHNCLTIFSGQNNQARTCQQNSNLYAGHVKVGQHEKPSAIKPDLFIIWDIVFS